MLPFSKRPPPPDEYLLRSGDLEAVRQDPYSIRTPAPGSYAPASYPPPSYAQQPQSAPPPAFVRQAAPTPYGFTAHQQQMQQPYGQYNDLSAPPPPHSLAPMAMSADSTNRQFANTGISHAQSNTMSGRDKPSVKWGVMIALSGALLGGVLGLGMDAHRQSARAAAAQEAKDAAPPAVVAAVQPVQPPAQPLLPVVIAPTVIPPTVAANVQPAVQPQVIAPPPVVLAVGPGVVVPKGGVHSKLTVKPHGFLAAKVTPPARPAPEPKAEAPEPKTAKADKADKADPPKTVKKDANTSDAMKILEAANKDTTNTL